MSFKITWEDVKEEADFSPIEEKFLLEEIPQKNISFSNEKPENIMIEGDNYPVLKLMQKKFEEKIDFIYIDPPYNTGKKSLCYNDNIFFEKKYLEKLNFPNKLAGNSNLKNSLRFYYRKKSDKMNYEF